MPEVPTSPKVNRAVAWFWLSLTAIGTAALVSYGYWELIKENRGDGILYLSLGLMWFLFFSWRVRWATHPKATT